MANEKGMEFIEHLEKSKIVNQDIENQLKRSFISYAMAVNISRAIPDVRDGLKPVHRRILYSMYESGLTPDKPYRKCATTVGDVLGKYHPHGDAAVYDAMVRLVQDFSINDPLIDGHGNFGSIDGDPAAANRYTEARLSKISLEMLRDIDKKTVDFYPNFDETREQPVVLPSKFPNILVNGADGIAVGMATSIPPHNLVETIDATIALLNNADLSIEELMQYIKAPDFPTGGLVFGGSGLREAYRTGKGKVILRAKCEIEEKEGERAKIVITELPYQINKEKLVVAISDLHKEKKIDGIADLLDESDRRGLRITVTAKRDCSPQVLLNQLFKKTNLQITYSIIFLALVDGVPKILNLKEILTQYIAHQMEVIVRRTKFDLERAEERLHILEGLSIALANIDEVVEVLKKSKDRQDAMANLMERFILSERQATAILDMRLQRLTGLEVEKIENEKHEKEEEIKEYKRILSSDENIKEIVRNELTEIKEKYGVPRKTQLAYGEFDLDQADLIPEEDIVISMSHAGYIKRMAVSEYRTQRRGGIGVAAHKTKEEDFVEYIFIGNSHQKYMIFTSTGKAFAKKGYEIPEASRTARGRAIINLLEIGQEEKIKAILPIPEDTAGKYLVLATKQGLIKKTPLEEFDQINRTGKIAIKFNEDDELISAVLTNGEDELIIAANNGNVIRCSEKDVRPMGRSARGVKAMDLDDGETLVDVAVIRDAEQEVITVTTNGYGKRSSLDDYRLQRRAGKGIKAGTFNEKTGDLASLKILEKGNDLMLITDSGIVIKVSTDDISRFGRTSQGVRIMKMKDGDDKIASIAIAPNEDELEKEVSETTTKETAEENIKEENLENKGI
jgi:DNA gyrase, A subunit